MNLLKTPHLLSRLLHEPNALGNKVKPEKLVNADAAETPRPHGLRFSETEYIGSTDLSETPPSALPTPPQQVAIPASENLVNDCFAIPSAKISCRPTSPFL
jgi:hypothetical protein